MAQETEVCVPDIGDFEDVEIIEVLVSAGDSIEVEDSLITLESDKATMEIPSPVAGVVRELRVVVGDRVSEGAVVLVVDAEGKGAPADASEGPPESTKAEDAAPQPAEEAAPKPPTEPASEKAAAIERPPGTPLPTRPPTAPVQATGEVAAHASPLVRGVARELGVDLRETAASGPAGRVLENDVKEHVRQRMSGGAGGAAIPAIPAFDFSKFGPIEEVPLGKIRRVSATNLHRSWLNVPHVTQFDEADITDLETFRKSREEEAKRHGVRLSPLLFVMKAVVIALRRFPDFRSSRHPEGQSLIRKNYFHLGIAVDTEEGLVVPVVRDVDQKSIYELASEVSELAAKARVRKLGMKDLQGAVFTISSLGGIGGTAFTPIVNAPEVAILGVSRTATRPIWKVGEDGEGGFLPRKMLPLSLSYDHRVIDGAVAVRFTTDLVMTLGDPVNLLV